MTNLSTRIRFHARSALMPALVMTLLASFVVLPACNTVKGAGKDIQNVGEAGEKVITGEDSN